MLACQECFAVADDAATSIGWRGYLVDDEDGRDYVVVYCAECTEREFGPLLTRSLDE